jgi:hypothetical protein
LGFPKEDVDPHVADALAVLEQRAFDFGVGPRRGAQAPEVTAVAIEQESVAVSASIVAVRSS